MGKICIFPGTATPAELLTNGIGYLDATFGDVFEEINGAFTVDMTVPIGSRHADAVVFHAIIRAMTPHGEDYFRLDQPSQTLTEISVKCWQLSYDMEGQTILGGGITNKTGAEALPAILAYCPAETRFSGTSDITDVSSLIITQQSLLSAFINTSVNCFLTRWGGEIERNRFAFNIKRNIGEDHGYRIAYGRNLTGVSIRPTGEEYINRVYPKCLQTDPTTGEDIDLFLPEQYIDSAKPNTYDGLTHSKIYKCEGVKVGAVDQDTGLIPYPDLSSAYAKMRAVVAELYANGLDEPHFTMDITFEDLKDTEEYKPFKDLLSLNLRLGDTAYIDMGVMTVARRMSSYHFDPLAEKFTKITIGDKNVNIAQVLYQQGAKMALMEQLAPNGVIELSKLGDSILSDGKIKADLIDVINLIVQRIGNDATDPAFWATVGENTVDSKIYTGILGFLKAYSETNPALWLTSKYTEASNRLESSARLGPLDITGSTIGDYDDSSAKLCLTKRGYPQLSMFNDGLNESLYFSMSATTGLFSTYGGSGVPVIGIKSGNYTLAIDSGGVYGYKSGLKTYLFT